MKTLRSYLLTGVIVWTPILVTIWVLQFIVSLLDSSIALLPDAYQPARLSGINMPGYGVIFSLLVLLLTGIFATNFLGQRMVEWSESFLDKIPLVRSIYNTSKQVMQAVFSNNSTAFRKVVLIEYPRKGAWTLAFQTSDSVPLLGPRAAAENISVFVPTTPNPTGGYLLIIPKSQVKEVSLTVDEALKYIISLGVMQQSQSPQKNHKI